MCIRSKHDAITAWCAAVGTEITSLSILLSILPISSEPIGEEKPKIQSSVRVICIDPSCGLVSRHSNLCTRPLVCLILISLLTLCLCPHYASSAVVPSDHMRLSSSMDNAEIPVNSTISTDYSPPHFLKRRRRDQRALPDRQPLSLEVISYVCDNLTDSCTRAAFLRRHVYHNVCVKLPLLYLLPHIGEILSDRSNQKPACNGSYMGLKIRRTDGLYDRFLNTPQVCRHSLETLDNKINTTIRNDVLLFADLLKRSFCSYSDRPSNRTGDFDCNECQEAYSSWVCSSSFPIQYPISNLSLTMALSANLEGALANFTPKATFLTSQPNLIPNPTSIISNGDVNSHLQLFTAVDDSYRLVEVPACSHWCTDVETRCPYLNPEDVTSNGGEPTFLCDESHYQYIQYSSSRSGNDCKHDCCFTAEDLEKDLNEDSCSDSPFPNSVPQRDDTNESWTAHSHTGIFDGATVGTAEYISLATRCIQEQFSKHLETAAASRYHDNHTTSPILQNRRSFLLHRSSSAVFGRATPNLPLLLIYLTHLYK